MQYPLVLCREMSLAVGNDGESEFVTIHKKELIIGQHVYDSYVLIWFLELLFFVTFSDILLFPY